LPLLLLLQLLVVGFVNGPDGKGIEG
jgi:hypothetical protein